MLLPLTGAVAALLAALWLIRSGSDPTRTRTSSHPGPAALGTGLALALPMLAASSAWLWIGTEREARLALIAATALPVSTAMIGTTLALLRPRHGSRATNPPRSLGIGAMIIAAAIGTMAATGSIRLVDAQAIGLFAMVWWWWDTLGTTNHPHDATEQTAGPHTIRRAPFLAAVALATLGTLLATGDWRAVSATLALWSLASAWFLRRHIPATGWAPPIGLAAGASALGIGWLGIIETVRVVARVYREAAAIGIPLDPLERVYLAAEALGARPTIADAALLGAPAAAIAAIGLFVLLIRRHETEKTEPASTPWRAGAVAGVWLILAIALLLVPTVLVLR